MVRFQQRSATELQGFFAQQATQGSIWQTDAARYGQALALLKTNHYQQARPILESLARKHASNIFILDAMTDLDNAQDRFDAAITRLQAAQQHRPDNQVVMINLADSLLQAGRHQQAATLLDNYLRRHPENLLAWDLIAQAYRPLSDESAFRQAQAEVAALKGRYDLAVDQMEIAANLSKDSMQRARLGARLEQLRQQQKEWEALRN